MSNSRFYILLIISLALTSCANKTPPTYVTSEKSCALLIGGLIPEFNDPGPANMWFNISSAMTNTLQKNLSQKYKTYELLIKQNQTKELESLVATELAKNQCNRIIQFTTYVNQDNKGPYFEFDVSMMRTDPNKNQSWYNYKNTSVITAGEYDKKYRYPRTKEMFDKLQPLEIVNQIISDLEKSGSLKPITRKAD